MADTPSSRRVRLFVIDQRRFVRDINTRIGRNAAAALAAAIGAFGGSSVTAAPLQAIIASGGPDFEHNQTAIESNVRYVSRLLPAGARSRVLFADGSLVTKDVQCLNAAGEEYYRAPDLPSIDGPDRLVAFQHEIETVEQPDATHPVRPLLLYFTGHGSPNRKGDLDNNQYDMWHRDGLSVQTLATDIDSLPPSMPVTVVMAQCFSGSFGNLIFQGADPKGKTVDRDICGFFASVPQRPAAGCTPEVRESYYRDFTGYFFSALSGQDRLGRQITGADYNHDGTVGMDEAFAYTLFHDVSIDTPVCTSDVFLRRFVTESDDDVFKTPFPQVYSWATPAQKAALDGLSDLLKLSGDDRLTTAHAAFQKMRMDSDEPHDVYLLRFARLAKSVVLAHTLSISGDDATKKRYAALIASEARNPLLDSGPAAAPSIPDPLATAQTVQVTEKFYLNDDGKPFLHQILHVKAAAPGSVWIQGALQPRPDRTANALKPVLFVSDGRMQWEYKGATNQYSETDVNSPGEFNDQLTISQYQAMLNLMPLARYHGDNQDNKKVTRTVSETMVDGKPMLRTTMSYTGNESHSEFLTDARTGLPYRFIDYAGGNRMNFRLDFSQWVLNDTIPTSQFVLFPPPGAIRYPLPQTLSVGQIAPDFAAVTPDGKMIRLSDLRGRPVVLDFWSTWNAPSVASLARLQKIAQSGKGNVAVLAVCVTDRHEAFDRWMGAKDREKYSFSIAFDPAGEDDIRSVALNAYNLKTIPAEFVLDKDGKIAAIIDGKDIDQQLDTALKGLSATG